MRKQNPDILFIGAFFIINLVIKLWFLDKNDIALDEPFSIFYAQMKIPEIISSLTLGNNPPLFEIILHYWIKLSGIDPFGLRLLPAIFSSLAVIFIFLTGKKFYSLPVACLASTFYTFSNYQIDYAHEIRVYSLFILLSSISLFLLLLLGLSKQKLNKLNLILLIIVNALLMYAHYFGAFVILVETISVITFKEIRGRFLKPFMLHIFFLGILYVPLSFTLIKRFIASSGGTWVSPPTIGSVYFFIWKLSNSPVSTIIILTILFLAFIYWYYSNRKELIENSTKVIITWFFFPLLFSFLVSFILPFFIDRYLVYISLAYYLMVAIAISYLKLFKYSSAFFALIVIIALMVSFKPNYGDTVNWKQLVNKVKDEKTNETIVIIYPAWLDLAFTYHYNLQYFNNYSKTRELLRAENIYPVIQYSDIDITKISNARRVLFIDENGSITPDGTFLDSFNKIFPSVTKFKPVHGPILYIFSK